MISIVIPLYNKAEYLTRAIVSVEQQTFKNFELIVVNDGSTDNSLEVIKELQKNASFSFIIETQKNAGVSSARNRGVELASNNYVAFLDADDWWKPTFLSEMNLLIEQYPDVALYGSDFYIVKNGSNKPSNAGISNNFNKGYINYFNAYSNTFSMPFNSSCVVIKKSVFINENGFKPELKFSEDTDLWVRLALKYRIGYVNKLLSYYNQDVDVTNRALGMDKLWKKEEHFIFNLDYLQEEEQKNSSLKKLLDGLRVRALLRYYLNNIYHTEVNQILSRVDFREQPKGRAH